MKHKLRLLACSLSLVAAFSANSAQAEPTLDSILPGFSNVSDSSFTSFARGTKITFTLASENTAWDSVQTFSILEGSTSKLIFAGSASENATFTYTVTTSFSGFSFAAESGTFLNDYSKVLFNSSTGAYALAHEDWVDGDYNDMVITASVSSVPEPKTDAMLLAGIAAITFLGFRKKT